MGGRELHLIGLGDLVGLGDVFAVLQRNALAGQRGDLGFGVETVFAIEMLHQRFGHVDANAQLRDVLNTDDFGIGRQRGVVFHQAAGNQRIKGRVQRGVGQLLAGALQLGSGQLGISAGRFQHRGGDGVMAIQIFLPLQMLAGLGQFRFRGAHLQGVIGLIELGDQLAFGQRGALYGWKGGQAAAHLKGQIDGAHGIDATHKTTARKGLLLASLKQFDHLSRRLGGLFGVSATCQ